MAFEFYDTGLTDAGLSEVWQRTRGIPRFRITRSRIIGGVRKDQISVYTLPDYRRFTDLTQNRAVIAVWVYWERFVDLLRDLWNNWNICGFMNNVMDLLTYRFTDDLFKFNRERYVDLLKNMD